MCLTKRAGFLTGAAALILTGGVYARPADSTDNDELRARLLAAEARLAELEATDSAEWLTEERAEEIRGLVQDVLADADMRASLLGSGITAGYDNGAVLGSSDGNWLLRTNVLIQSRSIYNDKDSGLDDDDDRRGFEVTRAKLILSGHVVSPEWRYMLDVNFGVGGGDSGMFDLSVDDPDGTDRTGVGNAWISRDFGNGWYLKSGQMKAPLLREELVDAQYQLAIERSVLNYFFTGGYVDGIDLGYAGDSFRFDVAFTDGARTGGTVWQSADTDYAFTVRGEFLLSGNWDQFMDFTSPQGDENGVMIGGAFHYQQGEDDTSKDGADIWVVTGDLSWEFGGGNLFASVVYADIDIDTLPGPADDIEGNPLGFLVQGGWYLNETWELYGRYEWCDFDVSGVEDLSIATIGVNKYFAGHNAKWSLDWGYAFDELDGILSGGLDPITMDGYPAQITGWRTDAPDEDGQWVLRTQLQILF
jgi:hypothetical protein